MALRKPKDKTAKQNKTRRRIVLTIGWFLILAGLYLLGLVLAPLAYSPPSDEEILQLKTQEIKENKIIIPKIKVDLPIKEGGPEVLHENAWHRKPENGNPKDGGNFVVSAHRFVIDYTPGGTRHKSFFYNIDKLIVGDEIVIHWYGELYNYKITEKQTVKPDDVYIEDRTDSDIMTVYSCTLGGSADGREVLIAKQIDKQE